MLRRDLLKAIPASLFLTGFPNLGATKNLKDGVKLAADALLSGKTKKLIENLKSSNPSLS